MAFNAQGGDIQVYAVGRNREKAAQRLGEYFQNAHFHFIEQDVREPLPDSLQVDYLIPLASNTHPMAYSRYPVETIEINVKGAEHALKKAADCGAVVLYPSSVEIYGNARGKDIFMEDYTGQLNLANSRACYPESKRLSEALCLSYHAEHHVDVRIARLSRIFGPTMLMSDSKASSQFIKKALEGEDIVLKSEGKQYFSYTYVADAVIGLLTVMLHGENGVAYNVSSDKTNISLRDFAQLCAECVGRKVVFDLPSETESKGFSVAMRAILSNERIKKIGFIGKYEIKDAIRRTVEVLKG
jgi:nucleoside-diphosphate-sugar epimerase